MTAFKERGRTWTAFIDADEYLVVDYDNIGSNPGERALLCGFCEVTSARNLILLVPLLVAGTLKDSGYNFLQASPFTDQDCVMVERHLFGDKINTTDVPQIDGIDPLLFSTLKFPTRKDPFSYQRG